MRASRISTLLLSLTLIGSVACQSTQPTAPKGTAAATVVAKAATATSIPAPTQPPAPTSTPVPTATPVPQGGTVTIHALFVSTDANGKASGGTEPVQITVAPKTDPGVRVSFSESEVAGQGNEWQAAGWTAAVQSALLLGVDPSKLSISYQVNGHVDGPSAGALMTIGTLAAILGDKIPSDFAMTGTINPDGSIGPVGGIPQKIVGAAKAGIKTILVPVGQRTDVDENTGKTVDLVRLGEDNGVTVKLVSNIYDAYKAATGKSLPQPKEALSLPQFPQTVGDKMNAAASTWLAQNSDNQDRFKSLSADTQKQFASQMQASAQLAQGTVQAQKEGNFPVALERAEQAVQISLPTERQAELFQTIVDRGVAAGIAQVQASASTRQKLTALYDRLRAQQAASSSDAVTLIDAYSNAVIADHAVAEGDAEAAYLIKNNTKMTQAQIFNSLFQIADDYGNAEAFVQGTTTELDLYLGQGSGNPPSLAMLNGLGEMLRQAGQANLAAFNSTVVSAIAQQNNVRDEVVQQRLASLDQIYSDALYASQPNAIQSKSKSQLTQLQNAYFTLGAALDTYGLSTAVLSKYYSLDAHVDKNFNITGYGRETALESMLTLGQASSHNALGVTKDIPLPALYYAANADAYREGNAQDKMDALFYYWQSTVLSKVYGNMTGEWGDKIQSSLAAGQNGTFLKASSYKGG